VPDDLIAYKVEKLQSSLNNLGNRLENVQKELQRQLDALRQQITTYIDEDRAARSRQFAQTALVDARAEHDRRFGHRQMVRRSATGMLQVMTTGTVRPAAFLRAAEHLMVDASDYWLSPAQVVLAAWAGNRPVVAERAVLEAVSRDPARSALFFSLVLARFGRQAAAADWIAEYTRTQDCNALTEEFTAVLDAVAQGALGGQARERLLDACRSWRDQIGQSDEREAKQVASWTQFIRGQRRPLADKFQPLGTVSRDWVATLGALEATAAFGHTEQWLKSRLGGTNESDEALRAAADLLRELIAAPDQAEDALLEAARRYQAMIKHDGHPPTPASDEPGKTVRTDFLTLSTAIATGTYQSQISEQAVRFCLALSGTSAERAVTDLSEQVRSTYPASIEVDIEGWHHAIEPGDDPDALVQKFSGWAQEAMTRDKAQTTHKRLIIGKTSTRLEHIESRWEARKQEGQESVYLATMRVNLFYQEWQQGIAAAARCADLLRAQPARVWSDAQDSRPLPGPTWSTMKLPDWDPRPPSLTN